MARQIYIDFISSPSNCKVYWDGKFIGTTYLNDFVGSTGRHTIKMTKDGYEDWSDTVDIPDNVLTTWFKGTLAEIGEELGEIRFTSDPSYADITLDAVDIGERTPETVRDLAPGRYYWILRKKGYDMASGDIRVRAGERSTVHVDFIEEQEELSVEVLVKSIEKGTEEEIVTNFWINDVFKGTTPKEITLPKGTYKLKATLKNYKDFSGDFTVTGKSETMTVFATMELIEIPEPPPIEPEPPVEPEPEPEPEPEIPEEEIPEIPPEEKEEEEDKIKKYLPYGLLALGGLILVSSKK